MIYLLRSSFTPEIENQLERENLMKKSTILLLTAILILSFSACAGPDSPAESASGTADTVSSDDPEEETTERVKITMDYKGEDQLEERDVLAFTELDKRAVMGIATSNSDVRTLNIPPGNYVLLSSTLGALEFKIEEDDQEIIVHADYESGKLSIEKKNEENN